VEQSDEGPRHDDELSCVHGESIPVIQGTVQRGPVALCILQIDAYPGAPMQLTPMQLCNDSRRGGLRVVT